MREQGATRKKLAPVSLSRGLKKARDAADPALFRQDQATSFHQIRGLGAKQLRDAGIDLQALLGHRDAGTTRHYLDHEIQWSTRLSHD